MLDWVRYLARWSTHGRVRAAASAQSIDERLKEILGNHFTWFNNRRPMEPFGNIPPAAEERYYVRLLEQPEQRE